MSHFPGNDQEKREKHWNHYKDSIFCTHWKRGNYDVSSIVNLLKSVYLETLFPLSFYDLTWDRTAFLVVNAGCQGQSHAQGWYHL